ncbi:MAG TPA: prolyl oligopeptidase family serine peptidase [Thermoanaerobacterales bacterium]|nr:prolyl oligopeptidase family serine peptidase [Thermoanaerobacterales bacterium]
MSIEDNYLDHYNSKSTVTWQDYARADMFLPKGACKLMFGLYVKPNWIDKSDCFWYRIDTRRGNKFMFVNPEADIHEEAFDHERLAAELSRSTGVPYTQWNLPFERFDYSDGRESIAFDLGDMRWKCNLKTYELTAEHVEIKSSGNGVKSPDGRWDAFIKDYNLYVRSEIIGEEIQLTSDGQPKCHYGLPLQSPLVSAGLREPQEPAIIWSPDSTKLLTYKIDHRDANELQLIQSVPKDGSKRPKCHPYVYPLPGDENLPKVEPVIIDVEKREQIRVEMEPISLFYYEGPYFWVHWAKGKPGRIYLLKPERGFTALKLYVLDPETGAGKLLATLSEPVLPWAWGGPPTICEMNRNEENSMSIDEHARWIADDGREFIWISQQDGWAHLYLYDGLTGKLKRQITSGSWVVREIKYVDEKEGVIYFTAGGREPERDPYYRHLYRVKMDGSNLQLLTPEDAEHEVTFSPTGKYFVDTYSRVDLPPVTVLRNADGKLVRKLEEADIELLLATGWKFPERFCAKARDGVTDIYGVIIRPSNFDPSKKYPVIEGNYSGPHTIRVPKAFAGGHAKTQFWHDQALAELGFIVVSVDGLGMAFRSKAFQDFSYKNLGDAGLEDHIAAFRQLAARYPYMDLNRVGIYGYSAGGYAAAHAILAHPDFYKVAVAWAGNHDHRIDKASWVERYMGFPVGGHYEEQANPSIAHNLKGKLFLMHGEMDENVPPAATLQLVDALIKANKDFDFLILPNGVHGSGNHPYVTRKRWDYFVQHLLGATPPHGYIIKNC